MLLVNCSGSPREIGTQHGQGAKEQISRCIDFYASLFQSTSSLAWKDVLSLAEGFAAKIKATWPAYYEEMEGIAEGSGHSILDIVALNVRTEIAFGCFSDGCTSLAWQTDNHSFLAQNWDWQPAQKPNLIILSITQPPKPAIQIVTEAGIIGKIGLNSSGVGVCMNAIRAKGVNETRLPVHLALRLALDSSSATEARDALRNHGLASSAHILIADAKDASGCEFTSTTTAVIPVDAHGRVAHSNHLLLPHPGVVDTVWLTDSPFRVERALQLSEEMVEGKTGGATWEGVAGIFRNRVNAPAAICRTGEIETLFNIVMELKERRAVVRLGRPDCVEEVVELRV
ncbi:AAT-domain-containing protein [Aspergillus egyptiacus]|nr:AAT-domain-containing protein [Aspergillus egyptiacus]